MVKIKKQLGVKRKRGKKFKWEEPKSLEIKSVKTSSLFKDRRLGEKNPNLAEEERALLKFQRERAFLSRKKQKFELDDSLKLTHKGVDLDELSDDFIDEDLHSSSDEQPRKRQKLDDEYVENMHFGDGNSKSKSKDHYSDLIEKSKQQKAQRQMEKEENQEITLTLDKNFSHIRDKLKFRGKEPYREEDDYDKYLCDLRSSNDWHKPSDNNQQKVDEIRKSFTDKGEDWNIPDSYELFIDKISPDPLSYLKNMHQWNSYCLTKLEKQREMKRLIAFSIDFASNDWDLEHFYQEKSVDEVIRILKSICLENTETAIEALFKAGSIERELSLNYITLFYLVGSVFDVNENDTLTSLYLELSNYFLLYYDSSEAELLLLLASVSWNVWMKPKRWYCPEIIRVLKRILENNEEAFSLVHGLFKSIYTEFKSEKGLRSIVNEFNSYFPEDLQLEVPDSSSSMQLNAQKVKEIDSYEPLIYTKITSLKQSKDMNKEISETDKLKMEFKKGQKATMKVLAKEAQAYEQAQHRQKNLMQIKKEEEQKRIRNLLDQLQDEHKKVMTSNEIAKRKKKKSQRKAGNKF